MPALQLKKPMGSQNPTRDRKNPTQEPKTQRPAGNPPAVVRPELVAGFPPPQEAA